MLKLKIGTRGSKLALVQANWVKDRLMQHYGNCRIELVPIKTAGDRMKGTPISQMGGKGLFIKEIEKALIKGERPPHGTPLWINYCCHYEAGGSF